MFNFISSKVNPLLLKYGEIECRKVATTIINNSINDTINDYSFDNLFLITKKLLTKITKNVQLNLKYVEEGKIDKLDELLTTKYNYDKLSEGIIYEIPSGIILGYSPLNNLGPKIPVRLSLAGDIVSHVNTKVTNYGINNAIVEISIVLEVSEYVILPLISNEIKIKTEVPVAVKLIQGNVPNYYLSGLNNNSNSIAIPIK